MRSNYKLLFFLVGVCTFSCTKDFVEKNIKNDNVVVLAPVNNLSTPNNAITFWWEALDGAEKYKLQIVKPNFNATQQLVLDTNVTGDKFNLTLQPGTYQWRIKAINNGGSTQYTTYNLIIDTTSNLSTQLVIPIAPANNYLSGSKSISFSWNTLATASNYQVQILNSSNTIVKDTTTANNNLSTALISGGAYTWKVRALNAFSISQYNSPLSFTIDLTAPPVSVINSPNHGASVKDTTDLKWSRTSSDTRYDSLYISIDSSFTSIVSTNRVYNTKIKINALNPTIPVSSTYYWWRVKSVDSVGNKSGFSNQLKFRLIP
jgi:predicted secreted protein